MDIEEGIEASPPLEPKKPLFKKKNVKSAAARKSKPLDEDIETLEHQSSNGITLKRKIRPFQTFRNGPTSKSTNNIKKWSPSIQSNSEEEITGQTDNRTSDQNYNNMIESPILTSNYNEGDIITIDDMETVDGDSIRESPKDPKKYVPQLSDAIEKKLSKRQTLNEMVHEYDDKDEYDDDIIDSNYATIDPTAGNNELELDSDDELVNGEVYNLQPEDDINVTKQLHIDDDKYDDQLGDSDREIHNSETNHLLLNSPTATRHPGPGLSIVTSLTPEEEITKVELLIERLRLDKSKMVNEEFAINKQFEAIKSQYQQVLNKLNSSL